MKSIILREHEARQLSATGEVTVIRPIKIGKYSIVQRKWYGKHTLQDPDYLNDARLYMALAVEMIKAGCYVRMDWSSRENKFVVTITIDLDEVVFYDVNLGTAICLAYCKLHGLEGE